jgi:hypothetical protein
MGYYLQAFIGKISDLKVLATRYDKAKEIDIGQGLTLIPMTEELFDQINNLVASNSIDKFEYLTDNIENEILKHIGNTKLAYVEAEYFGGQGGQIAIIWNNNKREQFFEFGQDKINGVLKNFGIKSKIGSDEFDTVGLGRHRNTIQWIE